jgi:putative oxidoreductase
MNATMASALALVARLLLAVPFLHSGYGKIGGFAGTVGYITSKALPSPEVLAGAAIVVELIGGLMLVIGWKARWAAVAIAGFTLLAAVLFHNFWALPEAQRPLQQIMFLKNMAIIGGLLLVVAYGPGRFSIDRK